MDTRAIGQGVSVEAALRRASTATGVDFDYLLRTARRESGLDPRAKAPTSSAAGLFQFVDQTWFAMIKRHGAKYGLGRWADQIQVGADGRYHVSDPAARRAILGMRYDPEISSVMGAELASGNAAYLRGRTGREPSAGELYAAHFLGPAGSAKLIEAVQTRPGAPAAALFPEAAQANRSIFFRDGRPATVSEVYANLHRTGGDAMPILPGGPSGDGFELAGLDAKDLAIARRLDRLKHDREMLDFLIHGANGSNGGSLFEAQLLSGFGPERDEA